MNSIEAESEDLFASEERTEHEDESSNRGDEDDEPELSAAAALTSLVTQTKPREVQESSERDEDEDCEGKDETFEIPERFTKSGRKRAVSFPLKLMKVLSNKKFEDIIAWTPSGTAFEIRKPKQFAAEILPTYFKSAKYSSFTRKLHRWGFVRHYRGEEAGAFYHKEFLKDRLDLVEAMTCHKQEPNKGGSVTAPRKQPSPSLQAPRAPKAISPQPVVQTVPMASPPPVINVRPPMVSAATSPAIVDGGHVDLNAAIEAEVNRRLNERLNQAAINRQALALMEQQQHQQQQAKINALLEQRYLALARAQQAGLAPNNLAMPAPGIGLEALYRKFKPAPAATYAFGDERYGSLPQTNIQGAKTA